ncbi:hypothetical protein COLO4_12037 [Corchorus olitorius]|uniref:Uncharacterized protein n=1 Tax=Corchorus olitorius TaxID=93759 RepID=A0A1R3K2F2_9ROSI|nr:hypothetical protein COLO4_12037 [Corchorus olitorius]
MASDPTKHGREALCLCLFLILVMGGGVVQLEQPNVLESHDVTLHCPYLAIDKRIKMDEATLTCTIWA